jgi:hypothetical protein
MLKYRPWIGRNYEAGFQHGLKLLIMGESNYDSEHGEDTQIHYTEEHIAGREPSSFRTGVERTVTGRQLDAAGRAEFWHSVALVNHVDDMIEWSRARPTGKQFRAGRLAFAEKIVATRPDVVFVFSQGAFRNLPAQELYPVSRDIDTLVSPWHGYKAYLYEIGNGYRVIAAPFNHPSRPLLPRGQWTAWANRVLDAAPSILRPRH